MRYQWPTRYGRTSFRYFYRNFYRNRNDLKDASPDAIIVPLSFVLLTIPLQSKEVQLSESGPLRFGKLSIKTHMNEYNGQFAPNDRISEGNPVPWRSKWRRNKPPAVAFPERRASLPIHSAKDLQHPSRL